MGGTLGFLKTTVLGGVIFLVPFAFLAMILSKAFHLMMVVAEPVDSIIPLESVGGIALVNVIAILAILASCFAAGLVAKSELGRSAIRTLDDRLLSLLPGYSVMKSRVTGNLGSDAEQKLRPVIARFDDLSQIAFEIERLADGQVVVFLPGSPDPWSGTVVLMTDDRVEPLGIDVRDAAWTCKRIGYGTAQALAARPGVA